MKITIPDVVHLFRAYKQKHPTWGIFHVVLDDGNHEAGFLDIVEATTREEKLLLKLLKDMSSTQRKKLPFKVEEQV